MFPMMQVLVDLRHARYGREWACGVLRLAGACGSRSEVGRVPGRVLRDGSLCGTCMDVRGLTDDEVIEGARRSPLVQLADRTAEAGKVLVF